MIDSSYRHKVRLLLSYDGSDFGGWQKQPKGKPTIQGVIEEALSKIMSSEIHICGSGRTDAGVHALNQNAHFWTSKRPDRFKLMRSLNSLTPDSIVLKQAWEAPHEFHAIASSVKKTYRYLIHNHPNPTALRSRYTHWERKPQNISALQQMSEFLVKKQDFKSFQNSGTEVSTTVREIYTAQWTQPEPYLLCFEISGNGFLKQMVRNIVGTQLQLLREGGSISDFEKIIQAQNRQQAGESAPPQGLYMYQVSYPSALDKRCRKI